MKSTFKKFQRDVLGLCLFSSSLFLGLALWSFNPQDPSLNSLHQRPLEVFNYCGYVGSFISDLLYQIWGLGAWGFVFFMIVVAWRNIKSEKALFSFLPLIWVLFLVFSCSSLFAVYFPHQRFFANQILIGGVAGQVISQTLMKLFNYAGVTIVLWTMTILLCVFIFEKPIQEIFSEFKSGFQRFFTGVFGQLRSFWKMKAVLGTGSLQKAVTESSTSSEGESRGLFNLSAVTKRENLESKGFLFFQKEENQEKDFTAETSRLKGSERRKVEAKVRVQTKIENWELPKLSLLEDPPLTRVKVEEKEIRRKADLLTNKLEQFSVQGQVMGAKPGPAVTLYEFKPNVDVRLSKITDLADDLSLALSSESVRIIAPIPGRDVVGIETSNSQRETVYLKDILAENDFWDQEVKLPVPLGKQANGEPKIVDLRKMPHLLVAGTTGSGKSVFTVSVLTGWLFKHSPKSLRLILIDPKQVDLASFNNIPHLLMPTVMDPKKAVKALRWAVSEMEKRYRSMAKFGARGLEGFNEAVSKLNSDEIQNHEKINEEYNQSPSQKGGQYYFKALPYIVVAVEEFGDLMAVDKLNVEQLVVRLAQMARACGIHLILAMQSPRKEVVTGLIKTNVPGRISFKVASKMDSRIILDDGGAERLLARGDMLFLSPGVAKPERHHGPWLSESEIAKVTQFWSNQSEPDYDPVALKALDSSQSEDPLFEGSVDDEEHDEMYDLVVSEIASMKEISASMLQRKYRLGYPRAARMIEILEKEGVVGPSNGSKPRQVLIFREDSV